MELPFHEALAKVSRSGDPLKLQELLWPDVAFYNKQRDIVYSVRDSVETFVTAGNQLGKDFVTGFIALSFFMAPQLYFTADYVAEVESWKTRANPRPHTRKVITTSVKDEHIDVLWGEIGRYINGAFVPLLQRKGGPLVLGAHEIRFAWEKDATETNVLNYLKGMVSKSGEGLSGHHAAYTMLIGDEASGLDDAVHSFGQGWAKRFLYIGNPNQTSNFFFKGVRGGDLEAVQGSQRYTRQLAEDREPSRVK